MGVEATGGMRWFERLLREVGVELWIGDPVKVRAAAARKPKTDKENARLLLRLLLEKRFPRIWVPTVEQRDARQLVLHRHRLVQTRTRAKNQLQDMARNEGLHPNGGYGARRTVRVNGFAFVALGCGAAARLARVAERSEPAD